MSRLESLELVDLAARLLGPFCDEVVFVGGVALAFLITEPGSRRARLTDDADVIVEAATRVQYQAVEERLRQLGFQHDQYGPICRFLHTGLVLDVMPVNEEVLGFSNQWYPFCFAQANLQTTPIGCRVRVINSPCFLACKFDAFRSLGREGSGDPLASRDFEDIISVLDGSREMEVETLASPMTVRKYLSAQADQFLQDDQIGFHVECCLDPDSVSQSRRDNVLSRLKWLAAQAD